MLILWKAKARNADAGYATHVPHQMEQVLGTCVDRGIKVVTNAGGLNPAGCADAGARHRRPRSASTVDVAHIEGDDLLDRIDGLRPQLDQPRHRRAADRRPGDRQRLPRRVGHRPRRWPTAPTSSCARASPTPPSSSARRRGGGAGRRPTGTASPAPSSPATSSSAAPRRPAATTPSSTSSPTSSTPLGFPIAEVDADGSCGHHQAPRHRRRASPSAPSPPSCSTRSPRPAYANPDVVARFDTIRARRGRPRPGAHQRRARRAGAADDEGAPSTTTAASATG